MDSTVDQPAAEREPQNVTPEPYMTAAEAAELRALFAGNPVIDHAESELRTFGVRDGESADAVKLLLAWPDFNELTEREVRAVAARFVPGEVIHFDAGRLDQLAACGYDLDRNGPEGWTTDRGKVTCAGCAEVVILTDPGEPERRTVSVECLTDELRAAGNAVFAARAAEFGDEPMTLPANATVAVVIRIAGTGALEEVFDTDATWRQLPGHDNPMVVLRDLLQVVVGLHGGGLVGIPAAELLMPTPDVLAALDGRPDAQLLTAPVHVLAMDVEPGMLLAPVDSDALHVVTGPPVPCARADCKEGASCVVVLYEGGRQHQSGYARIRVRIPVSVTR